MTKISQLLPAHVWFIVSAIFHYLGPSFAVLLFPAVGVLGVAWFRIASAALVLGAVANPAKTFQRSDKNIRWLLVGLGLCLAVMNTSFYLALERLPMSLVAAMEFVGTIGVALIGVRSSRNVFALVLAVVGVFVLIDVKWTANPWGLFWSALNALLFVGYIVLGHKAAAEGAAGGVARLSAAMSVAFIVLMPIGFGDALMAFQSPLLVLAGVGVGICSSVIPYICDQIAMSRLPRGSFALLLALLPATATVIAAVVLRQIPTMMVLAGIGLVMAGIAVHKPMR